MKTNRLEAFSDGVFAIAATLLILDVTADARGSLLTATLKHAWPQYAAYFFGFLVIGIWWVNHHIYVEALEKTDRVQLFFNVMFLSCIAFLPFPIRLIAEHVWDDGARAAVVLYGVVTTLAAVFAMCFWFYGARKPHLMSAKLDQATIDKLGRSILPGVPINAGATLVALWNPHVAIILLISLTFFYIVGISISEHAEVAS